MWIVYILVAVAMLAVTVIAHEAGHHVVARRNGMTVEEFSLGFGKRLASREWKGMRWSLKAIPLGGSVKIAGMTVEEAEDTDDSKSCFINARPWKRWKVAMAGVGANLLVCWVTFIAVALGLTPLTGRSVIAAPLSSLVVMGALIAAIVVGIVQFVGALFALHSTTHGSVGSVLTLPQSLHAGVHVANQHHIAAYVFLLLAFGALNLSLAIGNMIPLWPLDGFHGLVAFIDSERSDFARARSVRSDPSHSELPRQAVKPLSMNQLRPFTVPTGALVFFVAASLLLNDLWKL